MEIKEWLENWNKASEEHMNSLKNVMDDRNDLRELMKAHLSQFFEWDEIEFNRDFTEIILKWEYDRNILIKNGSLENLGMDFLISREYNDKLGECITITIYPNGFEES